MTRRVLAATAIACIFTASHWARAQQATVFHGDDAKWGPGPPSAPAGAQLVNVVGDPTKEGSYLIRMKAPAGYKVGPHVHPYDENVTVLSGVFHIGFGDTFDESKAQVVKSGGFVLVPKGVQHFAWASQETVIQLHGVGPQSITYLNPVDDPRKK
jgi:quercetin dioxygenase-like cupin family protein